MEEKVVGGKEKKYVLYTVVGEERGRATVGVWVVRVLLGTLLLVALAVVPYLSLRLAQVTDRTLVVFQPVPMRNHSLHHHHGDHHIVEHGKVTHVDVVSFPQSASLTKENFTAESGNGTAAAKTPAANTTTTAINNNSSGSAGSIVTLHESAVTLAVMEDTNATRKRGNDSEAEETVPEEDNSPKAGVEEEKKEPEDNATTEDSASTSEAPASVAQVAAVTDQASPSTPPAVVENNTGAVNATPAPHHDSNASSAAPVVTTVAVIASTPVASTPQAPPNTTGKAVAPKVANVSSTSSTTTPKTTTSPTTTTSSTSSRRPLAHKLVYMATSASGNHVGGFCVWKTDRNVTHWSYFYENIPIEYQSHQDSSDHEMRGMLAAVRTWAPLWNDHHVVLRSHHPAIKGSEHPTRRSLTRELEKLSDGRFSYELEWRLRKTDRVVDIAYCLSRLHRDYAHWFRTFQGRVDELLGQQNWATARQKNRTPISQEAFLTDDPEEEEVRGDK